MKEIDDLFVEQCNKNATGTLTVGEALINRYYRLLEGVHAGKVIIKTCTRIDDEFIVFFANGLTWICVDKLKNIRCEQTYPTFQESQHPIDRSQATWYPDNSNEPMFHEW